MATAEKAADEQGVSVDQYLHRLIDKDVRPSAKGITIQMYPAELELLHEFVKRFQSDKINAGYAANGLLLFVLALAQNDSSD